MVGGRGSCGGEVVVIRGSRGTVQYSRESGGGVLTKLSCRTDQSPLSTDVLAKLHQP